MCKSSILILNILFIYIIIYLLLVCRKILRDFPNYEQTEKKDYPLLFIEKENVKNDKFYVYEIYIRYCHPLGIISDNINALKLRVIFVNMLICDVPQCLYSKSLYLLSVKGQYKKPMAIICHFAHLCALSPILCLELPQWSCEHPAPFQKRLTGTQKAFSIDGVRVGWKHHHLCFDAIRLSVPCSHDTL